MSHLARSIGVIGIAVILQACVNAKGKAIAQASFDHDCPADKIVVVSEADGIYAYVLNVCGQLRKYRDLGNEKEFQFVDVTEGTPSSPKK